MHGGMEQSWREVQNLMYVEPGKKNRQELSDGFVKFLEDLKQIGDREKDYSL